MGGGPAGRRADERAIVRAAALRRAGGYIVAAVGHRDPRSVRPDRRSARTSSGRLADPAIRGSLRTQGARLESPVTGMVIDQLQSQARFSGPQLIFSQISGGPRAAARSRAAVRSTFSGGADRAQPVVQGQPGAAAQPRRYRRASDRAAADPFRRAGRDDLGQSKAQQGPLPARPGERCGAACRSSRSATAGSTRRRDRGRRTSIRGSSTLKIARQRPPGRRPRHRQPLDDRPQRSAASPTRRASPAAPTWCAATMISPDATSGSTAGVIRFRAKARPIRCSTSPPRPRSRGSTPASASAAPA